MTLTYARFLKALHETAAAAGWSAPNGVLLGTDGADMWNAAIRAYKRTGVDPVTAMRNFRCFQNAKGQRLIGVWQWVGQSSKVQEAK